MDLTYYEGEVYDTLTLSDDTLSGGEFVDCLFQNCSFDDLLLLRCSFRECRFVGCTVSQIKTRGSELKFCEFEDCTVLGLNWALLKPEGPFGEPIEKIKNCRIRYGSFTNMNLKKFNFAQSSLTHCTFADCDLSESDLRSCDLSDTEFFRCDLRKADLRHAGGFLIDVNNNQLRGAKFTYPEVLDLLDGLGIKIE